MRVLNIMLAKVKGGVETMALRYHEAMSAAGYDVLSAGHPDGMLKDARGSYGFTPLVSLGKCDPVAMINLRRIHASFQPHLVLVHGNRAAGLSLLPFMPTRNKTVQVMHNAHFKPHLKAARAALCVSSEIRDSARAAFPALDVFHMPNFSHLRQASIKKVPRPVPVIGALGRIHQVKGFDLLLKAAASLRDQGQVFRLKIAGDGPDMAALQGLCAELNLQDHVEFCGWVADPQAFMKALDLLVVPSRRESFGLVVIEAMAAGIPVVASDLEGPREILEGGRLGRLSKPEDIAALTRAIGSVFADWKGHLAMAREAQGHALSTFGFEAGQVRLRQTLDAIAHEPRIWTPHSETTDPVFAPVLPGHIVSTGVSAKAI